MSPESYVHVRDLHVEFRRDGQTVNAVNGVSFDVQKGEVMALIKPQFEAGKEAVGKNGIVRDPKTHERVLEEVLTFAQETKFDVLNLSFSPITGGEGNIEFIVHLKKSLQEGTAAGIDIPKVVASAHETFHQPK